MSKKTNNADFENDHKIYARVIKSKQYKALIEKVKSVKRVYIIGNGGLMAVSNHAAADLGRLVPNKTFQSFSDLCLLTSLGNDSGFENIFTKWLEIVVPTQYEDVTCFNECQETLVIGLSCSGNSDNVINALHWAQDKIHQTFLISGVKSKKLNKHIDELALGCKYFHTVEVLCMKLFYDIVYKTGNHCPTIAKEIKRKAKK